MEFSGFVRLRRKCRRSIDWLLLSAHRVLVIHEQGTLCPVHEDELPGMEFVCAGLSLVRVFYELGLYIGRRNPMAGPMITSLHGMCEAWSTSPWR